MTNLDLDRLLELRDAAPERIRLDYDPKINGYYSENDFYDAIHAARTDMLELVEIARKWETVKDSHIWSRLRGYDYCKRCGIVRRADDKNKPCKGVVKIGLRETDRERGE